VRDLGCWTERAGEKQKLEKFLVAAGSLYMQLFLFVRKDGNS
jgi:hypothetical protein